MILRDENCDLCLENKDSIFYSLAPKEKEALSKAFTSHFYKKGEIIYKEGDKPNGLICLIKGKVKVFKEGIGGREQIVRMARPIGYIGFRALFANQKYAASAVAIEDATVCVFEKLTLFKTIKANGDLSLRFLKLLASELGFSNSRTVTLTQKHIRGRLAESLLFLKDTYGYEEDFCTLKVYLSREDIANLSNMTTSNAIRTLSTFSNEKVIAIDGRRIKILDLAKLERISDLG